MKKPELAPDAHQWWRLWSMRLNAFGLAVMTYLWFDPSALLSVWNMMPAGVRGYLPAQAQSVIGGVLFALAMVSRLVCQPKLRAND